MTGVKHFAACPQRPPWAPSLVFCTPLSLTHAIHRKLRCQIASKNKLWRLDPCCRWILRRAFMYARATRSFMNTEVQTPTAWIYKENRLNWFHRPPITPYDLSVLLTTIVVGIAKALTTADMSQLRLPLSNGWVAFSFFSCKFLFVSLPLVSHVRSLYVIGWYKSLYFY